jgi:hypothetical protein
VGTKVGAHAANDGHIDRKVATAIGDRSPAMAQIYARDADRRSAQTVILEAAQKLFANIDRKTLLENGQKPRQIAGPQKGKKSLK